MAFLGFDKRKSVVNFRGVVIFLFCVGVSHCFSQSSNSQIQKSKQLADMFANLFDFVQRNYVDEVQAENLYKGALKGMMESLNDPYSVYLENDTMRSLSDTTQGVFGGVGLSISKPIESSPEKPAYVEVASPIEDSPGFKAGIQTGDLIISVEGTDTSTITMDEVLEKLRGKVGEEVHIVIRRGKNLEFPVTLVRALIEVPCVKYGMIELANLQVGYARLIEYTPQTAERLQEAIDSFKKSKFSAMILDLRNNPGGLITSAVEVCDKFLDSGTIVSTRGRQMFQNTIYTATAKATTMPKNIPLIVLINGGSASAAEITAGALKDSHGAYLVGTKSYGKGSVQQVLPLSAEDGIKMTTARYYTPSGANIDKIGIPPDKEVKFPELGEEGEKFYEMLIKDDAINNYVDSHKNMSEEEIAIFANELHKKYPIDERTLRKLVRNQVNRLNAAPLYDLDYDIQLNAALDILKSKNFHDLLKTTKTVKQLQEETLENSETQVAQKSQEQ